MHSTIQLIVTYFSYPKRWAFCRRVSRESGKPLFRIPRLAPTRWVPGARTQLDRFWISLPCLRQAITHLANDPEECKQTPELKGILKRLDTMSSIVW